MTHVMLIQLPVPQLNFGHKTGNIPFAAACLYQSASRIPWIHIDIFPQISASHMGDAVLLETILKRRPDIVGFTAYVWNVTRVLYLAKELKAHYSPRIVVGGPEATDDNQLLKDNPFIDFLVYGEGEALFTRLLEDDELWSLKSGSLDTGDWFMRSPSPYLTVPLSPEIENFMLLETMRGCPYGCAYCYYGKSRSRPCFKDDSRVMQGLEWALSHDAKEVYFLDPSLNSRPGLKDLLRRIVSLNKDHRLSLISEIRADAVDQEMAGLLADAGFTWFEIGLQSINPRALALTHRKTDLDRFIKGVRALKEKGITTEIDLIAGLPGDDRTGFEKTVQFVLDLNIQDDIQVFPLLVLPGTEFRRNAKKLGLVYNPLPPYTIRKTPAFKEDEILNAILYAGDQLDMALYPMPDLDLAFRYSNNDLMETMKDIQSVLDGESVYCKVWLHRNRTLGDLMPLTHRVTHPYQLLIPPTANDPEFITRVLSVFTGENPHTPVELVFFEPVQMPDIPHLLQASRIERPHYLDGDQRLLFSQTGNRAIMFTVITSGMKYSFTGPMQRHVFWWQQPQLPEEDIINSFENQGFDGILIDMPLPVQHINEWQDRMAGHAGDLIHISFARPGLNKRWLQKTKPGSYNFSILP